MVEDPIPASLTHLHYDIFEMFIKLAQYKTMVTFTSRENGSIESPAAK